MIVESYFVYKIQSAKTSANNCRPIASTGRHLGRHLPIAEPNSEGWALKIKFTKQKKSAGSVASFFYFIALINLLEQLKQFSLFLKKFPSV